MDETHQELDASDEQVPDGVSKTVP